MKGCPVHDREDKDKEMTLADIAAKQTKKVVNKQEKIRREEQEERRSKQEKEDNEWADNRLVTLEDDVLTAAKEGKSELCIIQWGNGTSDERRFYTLVNKIAERKLGLDHYTSVMEPVGSDPMFFNTVYSYYVTWGKKQHKGFYETY